MHATIKYYLSEAGQKASILAGGNGRKEQQVTVPSESPEFAAVLALAKVRNDGSVVWDREAYDSQFDTPQTAAGLLADWERRVAEKAAAAAAEKAELHRKTLAVLTSRKVIVTQIYPSEDGVFLQKPDWPYAADESVINSPEALAWMAELEAANAAAKPFHSLGQSFLLPRWSHFRQRRRHAGDPDKRTPRSRQESDQEEVGKLSGHRRQVQGRPKQKPNQG